jgi:protease-4
MGTVFIEGFGRQRNYYKEALDKLGIQANLIRVGQYKSAGEPFMLSQPSEQALKAEAHVYDALWKLYT